MSPIPQPPRSFTPPETITDSEVGFSWWMDWRGIPRGRAGASTLYDPENDRVFIEPRPDVFHDEMVRNIIEKSALPKLPERLNPGAAQFVEAKGGSFADIPTTAEGFQSIIKRLDGKVALTTARQTELEWVYKHVAALYTIDFPEDATVVVGYAGRGGVGKTFEAKLGDFYRELSLDNKLPEQRVVFDQ